MDSLYLLPENNEANVTMSVDPEIVSVLRTTPTYFSNESLQFNDIFNMSWGRKFLMKKYTLVFLVQQQLTLLMNLITVLIIIICLLTQVHRLFILYHFDYSHLIGFFIPCENWREPQHILFQLANGCFFISCLAPDNSFGILVMHAALVLGIRVFFSIFKLRNS